MIVFFFSALHILGIEMDRTFCPPLVNLFVFYQMNRASPQNLTKDYRQIVQERKFD